MSGVKHRIRPALVAAALLIVFLLPLGELSADSGVSVEINGRPLSFPDQQPVIADGRTLVPVRGVFEQLGFTVDWDPASKSATLTNGKNELVLIVGSSLFLADGKPRSLDVPAQIINGRTMLPFRAVLESVGCDVDWDAGRQAVLIAGAPTTGAAPPPTIAGKTLRLRAGSAFAELYHGPGTYHGVAAPFLPGDTGIILDVSAGWYCAEFPDGLVAWVSGAAVEVGVDGAPGVPAVSYARALPEYLSGVWAIDSYDGAYTEYARLIPMGEYRGEYVSNTLHRELGFTTYYERGTFVIDPVVRATSDGVFYVEVNVTRKGFYSNGYYSVPAANPAFDASRPTTKYIRLTSDNQYEYAGSSLYNVYTRAGVMPPENWSDGIRRLGDGPLQTESVGVSPGWTTRTNAKGDSLEGKFSITTGFLAEGKARVRDGTVYEGAFDTQTGLLVEGKALLSSNGAVYEGVFDRDTGNLIRGRITLGSGAVFEGDYDRSTGMLIEGKAIFDNGAVLEGSFSPGTGQMIHGRRTAGDGGIAEGAFDPDGFIRQGKITAPDGTSLEGDFAGGYPSRGKAALAGGYVYDGSFSNGGRPYNGTLSLNGRVYCTYFNGAAHLSGSGASSLPFGGWQYGAGDRAERIDWQRVVMSSVGFEKPGAS